MHKPTMLSLLVTIWKKGQASVPADPRNGQLNNTSFDREMNTHISRSKTKRGRLE